MEIYLLDTLPNQTTIRKTDAIRTAKSNFIKTILFVLFAFLLTLSANAATFTVNTLADNESNGCLVGQCTLREAVNSANAQAGSDTINFQAGLNGIITLNGNHLLINSDVTINGPGARTLSVSGNGQSRVFVITNPLVGTATANISGLTVTGGNALPILLGATLIGDGGGILNTGGATLNLTEVTVNGNSATSLGGGIANRALIGVVTTTNITRSTFSNNTATGGGGISNLGTGIISSAVMNITNSTVSNNSSLAEAGGISNVGGTLYMTNNTISNNNSAVAGGGAVNVAGVLVGEVYLRNTIIADNSAVINTNLVTSDVFGIFNSLGNNLIGNNLNAEASFAASVFVGGTPNPNVNADLVGSVAVGFQTVNPQLGGLQNNGGATDTRLPLAGSPAIDRGNSCVVNSSCASNNPPFPLTEDQRGAGFPRLVGLSVDIGATEASASQPSAFTVTTIADNETDGCGVNQCTLREAVTAANNSPDSSTINFQTGLSGTINLTDGQLVVFTDTTINGSGARTITVSGSNTDRVFLVATPFLGGDITVNISGLTISNGSANPVIGLAGDGGGILNGALLGIVSGTSTLNLTEVAVTNNLATTLGGGVATRLGAVTNITRSLISGNTSNAIEFIPGGDVGGGGLSNAALSTTTISNSTVTNNTSLAAGGGILNAAGIVNSTNNTITHNQSVLLGGGVVSLVGVAPPLGVTYLRNTIIANNDALFTTNIISSDVLGVLGSFSSLGNNLIGSNLSAEASFEASVFVNGSPTPNASVDLVGNVTVANQIIDPLLGALQNNGGPTDSRMPFLISPVINRGNNCVYTYTCSPNPQGNNPSFALITDQRGDGFPRLIGTVEIGAIEVPAGIVTAAGVSVSGRITDANGRGLARAVVTVTDFAGLTHTLSANQFGYFTIDGLEAGRSFVIQASHKNHRFAAQVITPAENLTDLIIKAEPTNVRSSVKSDKSL